MVDPTGCGDAYRAGLLYGIAHGWDWPSTGRLGSVMGAIKIAQRGAQNHAPAREEIEARFKRAFGYSPWKDERYEPSVCGSPRRIRSSFSRGGFFAGQVSAMPSPSWRGTRCMWK